MSFWPGVVILKIKGVLIQTSFRFKKVVAANGGNGSSLLAAGRGKAACLACVWQATAGWAVHFTPSVPSTISVDADAFAHSYD